jgi:hypothetical protein
MRAQRILTLSTILLALAAIFAFSWGKKNEVDSLKYQEQTVNLSNQIGECSAQVSEIDALKNSLQLEIDSLLGAYESATEANQKLKKKMSRKNRELKEKAETIATIQEANDMQSLSLMEQIRRLMATKSKMQQKIQIVERQNDSLVVVIEVKKDMMRQARKIAQNLAAQNTNLVSTNEGLTLKNFKATAFRVELEGKNGKLASKAKRIKKIKVSFDLNEIPEEYHDHRPIYMVIKGDKNQPISTEKLFPALIQRADQSLNIEAVMRKGTQIGEHQRLDFELDTKDKLEPGFYEVEIYTDIALLGAASFRAG